MTADYARARPARDLGPPVAWLDWPDYLRWLQGQLGHTVAAWGERIELPKPPEPGQHEAHIGPTGEGKSTHCVGRLAVRKWVLALDAKGGDETLSASGYVRVRSLYQPRLSWRIANRDDARTWDQIWRNIEQGRPARVIVGGPADDDQQMTALRELLSEAVAFCRYAGGWTFYLDEFEVMSSREIFNLARLINHMLISARHKGISVLTSYQAQAWVSMHAVRQARRAVMWPTGDRDMIIKVARAMGRDQHQLAEAIDALPAFHTVTIPRGPRSGPMLITSAPRLDGKGPAHATTARAKGDHNGRAAGPDNSRPGSDRRMAH